MLSKKQEGRAFSNGPLRDQWEKIAQNVADQNKQDADWKKKSSNKIAGSKWNYHWSLVAEGEFKKVTSGQNEDDNKPKIKFKVVPPPPKSKPEPPPPPPPPKKETSPKPRGQKRKVVVDVFRLCWKDSWMSLKPPKYLYLKAKEMKARIPGFTTIELFQNREYKAKEYPSEEEWTTPAEEWSHSWKQVKSPAQLELSEEKQFQWDVLYDRKCVGKAETGTYSLPVWAGTWKIMNFPFRQYKPEWDVVWPDYEEELSDKTEDLQRLEEEEELADWEESWKLSEAKFETEYLTEDEETEFESDEVTDDESEYEYEDLTDDETLSESSSGSDTTIMTMTRINEVFMPGWSDSWLISAAPPMEAEERQKSWSSCWRYEQQFRWCEASLASHHRHSSMLTTKRKTKNLLLTTQLDEEITDLTEWMEAWKTPKRWIPLEEVESDATEEEEEEDEDEREDEEEEEEEVEGVDNEEDEGVAEEEEEEKEDVADIEKDTEMDKKERDVEKHKIKEDKEMTKKDEEEEEDMEEEEEDEGVDEDEEDEEEEEGNRV
ncbi:uncharacterized protein LKV04_015161 [Tautogolabrus adspersus]